MKDFEDFKNYMCEHQEEVHKDIVQSVNKLIDSREYSDIGEEHEDYRRAWVETGFMKLIEQYHNWLNS